MNVQFQKIEINTPPNVNFDHFLAVFEEKIPKIPD